MIKVLLITSLLFFKIILAIGQNERDTLIISFYERHYTYLMGDTFTCSEQRNHGNVVIKTDLNNINREFFAGRNKLHFIADTCLMDSFWITPFNENVGRYYFTVKHKYISSDTVDIYDGVVKITQAVEYKKNKWDKPKRLIAFSENNCKGTCGYIADGRFVYMPAEKKWVYFTFENDCKTIKMKRVDK